MFNSKSIRGFTLIELMIVVLIIGILAALGSIGYKKYIRAAQMEELDQIALEFAAGEQQFRSRHNMYYPTTAAALLVTNTSPDRVKATKLLETRASFPPDIRIRVGAWSAGGAASGFCPGAVSANDGFCIRVYRDYDGVVADATDPSVYVSVNMRPVRLNEGNN